MIKYQQSISLFSFSDNLIFTSIVFQSMVRAIIIYDNQLKLLTFTIGIIILDDVYINLLVHRNLRMYKKNNVYTYICSYTFIIKILGIPY